MKKLFGLLMIMCSLTLLAGCAKEEVKEENAEARRIFAHSFVEEYEGENVELTHVVIFNEDGTGSMSIQDDIPFTYDDAKITNEDGSLVYDYVIDGDKLTINFVDFTEEFVLSDESVLD